MPAGFTSLDNLRCFGCEGLRGVLGALSWCARRPWVGRGDAVTAVGGGDGAGQATGDGGAGGTTGLAGFLAACSRRYAARISATLGAGAKVGGATGTTFGATRLLFGDRGGDGAGAAASSGAVQRDSPVAALCQYASPET